MTPANRWTLAGAVAAWAGAAQDYDYATNSCFPGKQWGTLLRLSKGVTMLFKKLFQLLVLGGAMVGTASGCAGPGKGQEAADKNPEGRDGGTSPDGGTAKAQDTDGGTAKAQDTAGGAAADAGGGVVGW